MDTGPDPNSWVRFPSDRIPEAGPNAQGRTTEEPLHTQSRPDHVLMARKWPTAQTGQRDLYAKPVEALSLPDKIPKGAHTIFVGVNPGVRSARIGHYYAGHSNYFWKLLFNSGLWPRKLTTEDDDSVTTGGFGFTDTCKRPTPGTGALKRIDFAESKNHVTQVVKAYNPKLIVFVSKTAVRAFLGSHTRPVAYGVQLWRIEDSRVFVVPSTSGASLGDTSYHLKLKWFRKLREEVSSYYPAPVSNRSSEVVALERARARSTKSLNG
jgi:double-stranded uracil-DNA glycosylase